MFGPKTRTFSLADVVSSQDSEKTLEAIVKAMADEVSDVIARAAPHYIRPSKRKRRGH